MCVIFGSTRMPNCMCTASPKTSLTFSKMNNTLGRLQVLHFQQDPLNCPIIHTSNKNISKQNVLIIIQMITAVFNYILYSFSHMVNQLLWYKMSRTRRENSL